MEYEDQMNGDFIVLAQADDADTRLLGDEDATIGSADRADEDAPRVNTDTPEAPQPETTDAETSAADGGTPDTSGGPQTGEATADSAQTGTADPAGGPQTGEGDGASGNGDQSAGDSSGGAATGGGEGSGADGGGGPLSSISAEPGLIFEKIDTWVDGFFKLLPNLAVAAIVFLLFLIAAFVVAWLINRTATSRNRVSLGAVLGGIVKAIIIIFGLLIAATIIVPSLNVGSLVAGLGVGSVAIGFAFKDILQNLFAGILILIRQPFQTGDQIITTSGHEGTVEKIETRATLLKTYDGRRVVIPNAEVYTNPIVVNTAFDIRRSEYDFGIHYDADTAEAMRIAVEATKGVENVESDPAPEALSLNLGDFSKVVRVRWWTKSTRAEVIHQTSDVMLAVEKAFAENGIAIPFPTTTMLWHDQTGTHPDDRTDGGDEQDGGKGAKDSGDPSDQDSGQAKPSRSDEEREASKPFG
ncbi:mechanosensitive ion channel domain-containing protein [Jannaschia donghaensis]|uniref:Small-conductance mechanosensitive channel n=1 Tax=Jannaschia donghaensis TaxID=420998 RepID=A0A0M6YNM8_9RHOB|nr:mechanosensitive ion channel domain-containing protein [Jannaschia donghaensis]CTQ51133.1 Small-conductance mechanosensitive channel [Jannaschia donghaensis]